mgnify:CR=1 FL=1
MNISNNTILITGGSMGIGLALAEELLQQNNTVIICARNQKKLDSAQKKNPNLHTVTCDVSDEHSVSNMVDNLLKDHPTLNILINNAGMMHLHDVVNNSLALEHQKNEILTNIFGVISLCDKLLPHLIKQKNAAIVNVTSGLAYMPFMAAPVYTATKAAIHSYSLSIRAALKNTSVTVFEVLPPMVETEMSHGMDMPGMKKMLPNNLAKYTIKKMRKDTLEIKPGAASMMIKMYNWFPWMINKMMDNMAPKLLADITHSTK